MTTTRKLLKLRSPDQFPNAANEASLQVIMRAIATRTCITAVYNKGAVLLAPHVVYSRDGALFTDAVTLERDGNAPRELKLGAFRLSGLANVAPTPQAFQAQPVAIIGEPRYAGGVLRAIEALA